MKAQTVDVRESTGRILCCTVFRPGGKKLLSKGHVISEDDVRVLQSEGMDNIWVTELEEGEVGEDWKAKSISHEHTFGTDTRDIEQLEATLLRLSEMVGRRLREQGFAARTMQLKLRYSDFSTITRAHSVAVPTAVDTEIFTAIRTLFHDNYQPGRAVRLLGVHVSNFQDLPEQMDLLDDGLHQKWSRALTALDRMRDKYGESAIFLAKGMKGSFRERVHENPAEKPAKPAKTED